MFPHTPHVETVALFTAAETVALPLEAPPGSTSRRSRRTNARGQERQGRGGHRSLPRPRGRAWSPKDSVIAIQVETGAQAGRRRWPPETARRRARPGGRAGRSCPRRGAGTRCGEQVEDLRLLLDDHLGRSAEDREDVDRDDEEGDEQHPADRLEEAQEPPPGARHGRELDEVGGDVEVGGLEHAREGRGREPPRPAGAIPPARAEGRAASGAKNPGMSRRPTKATSPHVGRSAMSSEGVVERERRDDR